MPFYENELQNESGQFLQLCFLGFLYFSQQFVFKRLGLF